MKGMPSLPGITVPKHEPFGSGEGGVRTSTSCLRPKTAPSKTGASGFPSSVKFSSSLVSSVAERPRTAPSEVDNLFYTEVEISKFDEEAYEEEQRGLEPGGLGEEEESRGGGLPPPKGSKQKGRSTFEMEHDIEESADMIETYEDYEDDSFDKGGFGEESDGF